MSLQNPPQQGTTDQNLFDAAQAAVSALNADSNYCASVGQNGSQVNSAVHAFKVAWNGTTDTSINGDPGYAKLAYNGQYDQACADALVDTVGQRGTSGPGIPPVCTGGGGGGGGSPSPSPSPAPIQPTPPAGPLANSSLPQWAWWVIGGIVVLGGAAIWWMIKHGKKRGVRRHHSRETAKKRPPLGSVRVTLPRKARGTVKRRRK